MPFLSADWIATVAGGDKHIENAATRLNEAAQAFGDEYSVECDARGCSALDHLEAISVEHVISHLAVAQALWGVRMKEHLFDLILGLQGNRVLVVALLARAILETAAVIVHLEGRLGALPAGAPEDGFRQILDELHGTVGRGRYPWGDMGDSNAMADHFRAYRAGKDPELSPDRRATNILTAIQKLDAKFGDRFADVARRSSGTGYEGAVRHTYSLLSDVCHPAAGTGILFLRPGARSGYVRVLSTTSDSETRWLFSGPIAPLLLIPPVARIAYESLERLGTVGFHIRDA